MNGLGSGENGQFTFLDSLALISFVVGIMNYNENLTQSDKQDLQNELNQKVDFILKNIHKHLEEQDRNIQMILEVVKNDRGRDLQ